MYSILLTYWICFLSKSVIFKAYRSAITAGYSNLYVLMSMLYSGTFGGSVALGGGLAFLFQRPRCLRIFFMTSSFSMTLLTFIPPEHLGHVSGSTSYIFWIRRAQFFRNALDGPFPLRSESSIGSKMEGIASSLSCIFLLPRGALLY